MRDGSDAAAAGGSAVAARRQLRPLLGRLYGWNTFGAVLGTLAGDLCSSKRSASAGAAFAAVSLNLVAAAGALVLSRRFAGRDAALAAPRPRPLTAARGAILAAAFLAGGILLALEVVWFRFLLSFTPASAWTFAVLLAVVLLGIAGGGLAASVVLGSRPDAHRSAPLVALRRRARRGHELRGLRRRGAGAGRHAAHDARRLFPDRPAADAPGRAPLGRALPAARRVRCTRRLGDATRATGLVTLANTTGAMLGALAAGFLLLPALGVERSLFGLACAYGLVALLALDAEALRAAHPARGRRGAALAASAALPLRPDAEPLRAARRLALEQRGAIGRSRSRRA